VSFGFRSYISPLLIPPQDGPNFGSGAKQLYARAVSLSIKHHALNTPRAPAGDQRTDLLRCPLPCSEYDISKPHSSRIWKTSNKTQALPLSPDVKKINPNGVAALAKDVAVLAQFVDSLANAEILKENLDELQQTVQLMQNEDPNDFYDTSIRNRRFGRVNALNGPQLLEKYDSLSESLAHLLMNYLYRLTYTVVGPTKTERLQNFSSRFGIR